MHDSLVLRFFGILVQKYIKKHLEYSNIVYDFIDIQKFPLPVQLNLDVLEKNDCQIRIQGPKKMQNVNFHELGI